MNNNFYYKYRGISGVYLITDLTNGQSYVGATTNIGRRWAEHLTGTTLPIQRAIQEKGVENFEFRVLEVTKDLAERERYWIEKLGTFENGYNHDKGGSGGFSEEARKKKSRAHKGVSKSEETRKKMSEAKKGVSKSEETRKKMSEAKKGVPKSEETRKRMSEARKGVPKPKFKWLLPDGQIRILSKQNAVRDYLNRGISLTLLEN